MQMEKICILGLVLVFAISTLASTPKPEENPLLLSSAEYRDWCNNPECHDFHVVDETEGAGANFRFMHCSPLFELLVFEIGRLNKSHTTEQARELPFSPNFCRKGSYTTSGPDHSHGPITDNDLVITDHLCDMTDCDEAEKSYLYWILVIAGLVLIILFSLAVNIWQYYAKKRAAMQYKNFGKEDAMLTDLQVRHY